VPVEREAKPSLSAWPRAKLLKGRAPLLAIPLLTM
jgi:hypothetical protein